jgi:hypothetical protein
VSDQPTILDLDAVDCRHEPIPWPFAVERSGEIERHWHDLKRAKPAIFNGRVLLLHRFSVQGGVFRGAYLDTDYASFIAFRDFGFPDEGKWNCFSMAALQSADGAFLLGEMAPHTMNAGAIYFAAGTPDLSDVVGDRVDLARSAMRELKEEMGVSEDHVRIAGGWTMVAQGHRIALMRRMTSQRDASTLRRDIERYLASESSPELAGIHVVREARDIADERMPSFQAAYLRHALANGQASR